MKIVDMHCDTLSALLSAKRQGKNFDFENSDTQISLSKMQAGDYLLQNFAIFVNLGETDSPLPEALEMILLFESEMEKHADLIRPVRSYADIEQNQADGDHVCSTHRQKKARLQWGIRIFLISYTNSAAYDDTHLEL